MQRIINSYGNCAFEIVETHSREEWLKERHKYIGASDAAAVLGISPWKTNVELWEEKSSAEVPAETTNEDIERGVKSEGLIRQLYAVESGHRVIDGTGYVFHSLVNDFMSCSLDGIGLDDDGVPYIIEIKSVRWSPHWRNRETMPDYYYTQVLHQLAVTKWSKAVLIARIIMPGGDVNERKHWVFANEVQKEIDGLCKIEERFARSIKDGKKPHPIMPEI